MDYAIVTCARSWIGTRFHHQGRLKKTEKHKGGVDCLGLLVGVAGELGLQQEDGTPLADCDEIDYSHTPDSKRLAGALSHLLVEVPMAQLREGDVLLLAIDRHPQHLAIVSRLKGGWGIIHSYAPAHAVVEHVLDQWWMERIRKVFRFSK